MLTPEVLRRLAPHAGLDYTVLINLLDPAMERFGIDTPKRVACFLSQVIVESNQFQDVRENLNYSANGLLKTWPTRFKNLTDAQFYERQPQKIANFVYANRMGNRDEKSGDGWRFRGAGWIQLTGRNNQMECALALGVTDDIGSWLATPQGAALSAAWFWWHHGCNQMADTSNIDAISDTVNLGRRTERIGDAIGYLNRAGLTNIALKEFA